MIRSLLPPLSELPLVFVSSVDLVRSLFISYQISSPHAGGSLHTTSPIFCARITLIRHQSHHPTPNPQPPPLGPGIEQPQPDGVRHQPTLLFNVFPLPTPPPLPLANGPQRAGLHKKKHQGGGWVDEKETQKKRLAFTPMEIRPSMQPTTPQPPTAKESKKKWLPQETHLKKQSCSS